MAKPAKAMPSLENKAWAVDVRARAALSPRPILTNAGNDTAGSSFVLVAKTQ